MHIDQCYYLDGTHFPGNFCPHDEDGAEVGEFYPAGWTAQQES